MQPPSQASVGILPTAFLGPGRSAELRVPVSACRELLLAQKKKETAILRLQRDILGDVYPEGGRVGKPGSSPVHSTFSCPRCQRLGHCLLPATNEIREEGQGMEFRDLVLVLVLALPVILWANLAILVT